ncbi:class 1b ribonucleoside-diphosphate reductase subunit beta [Candidatus Mycoplasma haematominutum]|uniref:Ribonucleoside-diphosphate reductase subunit beta n=1 Tax=Candidatus Mycoplasma haematominutum 'Birmingham 1' TaxID=1116213 RepID=G8C2Y5_9MOLU|nr:class 1b ribonucleoside-diphosphate reductase subunit beta [Candidatus Mycoplasma haematominutum]CCE66683.1 ribonucleoside-diphosphate reductase of class Ib(aerobic), beta subunit [Candidatus Mycoplasma haematominutum 'Birmingham 1']
MKIKYINPSEQYTWEGVNWNEINSKFTKIFWDQNVRQFWVDEEIPLSGDKLVWQTKLSEKEREVYVKVLGSLTLLDTHQGSIGMNKICLSISDLPTKAVLQFMAMMEQMHAKSYSSIFCTLLNTEEIEELFKWIKEEPSLQKKVDIIISHYNNIKSAETLYMAMAASVFLESFLFYSGFFYMLYLSAQGLMVNSGEIINLIIRDEAIHGLYIGNLASQLFQTFSAEVQENLKKQVNDLLEKLMANEIEYTQKIYTPIKLNNQVIQFLKYNANKALQNLNLGNKYDITEKDINPMIFNGLNTSTRNHDFFSTKGNGYIKTTQVETIQDEDFIV